jgi:hypothetical protein
MTDLFQCGRIIVLIFPDPDGRYKQVCRCIQIFASIFHFCPIFPRASTGFCFEKNVSLPPAILDINAIAE